MCPLSKRVLLAVMVFQAALVGVGYAGPDASVTIDLEPPDAVTPPVLAGDYNNNCRVEFGDISVVLTGFIPNGNYCMDDLAIVLENFGRECEGVNPGGDKAEAGADDDSAGVAGE